MAQKKDPKALMAEAEKHRELADAIEARAIRLALDAAGWIVARAAASLGWSQQHLAGLLSPGRRHAAIGEELQERRSEMNYTTGRPPANPNK